MKHGAKRIPYLAGWGLLLLLCLCGHAQDVDSEASWHPAWAALSALGDGYLVWESNRTGDWRIWTRNLDGSGERQLSPNEPGRSHFCPHISPDGQTLVYLSLPKGDDTYSAFPKRQRCPLHLITRDGAGDRILVDDARAYFEDRAVVWLTNETLIYIGGDGHSYQLDIPSGKSQLLTRDAERERGWLINATKTFATTGVPEFAPYHADTLTVTRQPAQGGCQPYFSHDGVWGFWMGGAGGPINKIALDNRNISPILTANDPRMPTGRRYLYFPMLSRCGRLFAFGASPNQHDHFNADYDIFVAQINPATLELVGAPARYTFDTKCDRFPDVYLAQLELGRHTGEAPYTVRLSGTQTTGTWRWDFGDGTGRNAVDGKHTYTTVGDFTVTARQGNVTLRGEVHVTPARPPQLVSALLLNDTELIVTFDEPVQGKAVQVTLGSGTPVKSWAIRDDARSLRIVLAKPARGKDTVSIKGLTDCAQTPNRLPAQPLPVQPVSWPLHREGLLYHWETGYKPNLNDDPAQKTVRAFPLKVRGRAHLNHDSAMVLAGGAYAVEGMDAALLAACTASNALTLEALIRPDTLQQTGPARIITFSSNASQRNFTLGQERDKLILRLRTPKTGENGSNPQVELCTLSDREPTHVIITYIPGQLTCYVNGKPGLMTRTIQGGFDNWTPQHLCFGDEWQDARDWAGTLEGIAIYARALSADEAWREYEGYRAIQQIRTTVPRLEITATLRARSAIPTLQAIAPYREALVVCEYQVAQVVAGTYQPATIRVAHWAMLDGQTQPIAQAAVGATAHLMLEPFVANPQLESIYLSDTLADDDQAVLYYDIRP